MVATHTLTEEELKEKFNERQRNRRLEDFDNDNFDDLIQIDDPFAIFKNASRPTNSDSEEEEEPKPIFKNRFS